MPIEIGSLVVRGSFGGQERGALDEARLREELARLRQSVLDDVADMIAEAERRRRER